MIVCSLPSAAPVPSTWSIMLSHTVGTPAEWVTPSSLNSRHMRSGLLSAQITSLQPGDRRRVGHAPAVGVEHRHDRQHDRARRQVENVGRDDRHGVKHGRAMLVEHALGIAGRAAGVAEAAGIALVALVPAIIAVLGGQASRRTRRRSRCNARSSSSAASSARPAARRRAS